MTLHIGVAGPIATEHIAAYLDGGGARLPVGYTGAPLTGVLIGELLRRGHKISAFTTTLGLPPGSQPRVAHGDGLTVYYCPARRRAWRPNGHYPGRALDFFAQERTSLTGAIRAAAPDLVHAHWTYEFALAALDSELPHLITCHDDPWAVLRFTCSPYRLVRYFMARQVFRRARALTAVSSYMADAVRARARVPIGVVPNPLAEHVLASGHIRSAPATRRIGMVCNGWDRRKNPRSALLAFARFKAHHPAAELHCFGHGFGPDQSAQRWAQQHGVAGGAVFHGPVPHRELIRQLDRLDLLLHPAREESFGVVIAEAMALGLPVVAGRDSGAVPWVVGQGELPEPLPAVLVDVSRAQALEQAMERAFGKVYCARSAAGYARARARFSAAAVIDTYLAHYFALVGEAGRAGDADVPVHVSATLAEEGQ